MLTDTSSDSLPEQDVVFIGSGVSTGYCLLSLLGSVRSTQGELVRTAVVDVDPWSFGGVPYGPASGTSALIITALDDFLPEPERQLFARWLSQNKGALFEEFQESGTRSLLWWKRHCADVAADRFGGLHLPRFTFGRYMCERLSAQVSKAKAAGWLEHSALRGRAESVVHECGGYVVTLEDGRRIRSRAVLLGVGSMSTAGRLGSSTFGTPVVEDPYVPSLDANLNRLRAELVDRAVPRILVVGSNASAMEFLYLALQKPGDALDRASFEIVSPRGGLPERIRSDTPIALVATGHLDLLRERGGYSAKDIYIAAMRDLEDNNMLGYGVAETLGPISSSVVELARRLTRVEMVEFAGRWGVEIGRFQRRAGDDYWLAVDELRGRNRLLVRSGKLVSVEQSASGLEVVIDREEAQETRRDFDAVVNCGGFSAVSVEEGTPLAQRLVTGGLCSPTTGGRGLLVNDRFEAAPGFFVNGPLLAGNVVNGQPIWHVEHCGRISQFGAEIGKSMVPLVRASPTAKHGVGPEAR